MVDEALPEMKIRCNFKFRSEQSRAVLSKRGLNSLSPRYGIASNEVKQRGEV